MMRPAITILAAMAALSIAPRPAAADGPAPRLPAGWSRGGARLEKLPETPPRAWGTMQDIHESSFSTRPPIPGDRVDLAALPVVEIAPVPAVPPPATLPEGGPGDVVILKAGGAPRVSVRAFEAGMIQVGKANPTAVGRQSEGGAVGVCGPKATAEGLLPLRYEAIRRIDPKGHIELVWARGFLDTRTCGAAILERLSARPQHIGGGVVYAFRTHCAACGEADRDVLHVLTPQMKDRFERSVPFEHRTLSLVPGKSAAFEGSSSFKGPGGGQAWNLPDWHGVIDRRCGEDTTWCFKEVRLEVSQGLRETSPTVFLGGDVKP